MPVVGPEQTIVQVHTTAEVAQALRDAAERGDVVVARGAGTKQNWGGPLARQPDTILDLSGHDAVLEYEPGDLVVRVAAGCPLAALQATIGEHGQRLSIDEIVPGSTIGGVLATGASGPLRHRFGTPRDLILGATVVLADGTVTKSGSKVVKNVAGYDLARLHTGAFGSLGIIAEATFRLHPLPDARRWVTAIAADEAALRQALATTHASLDDLAAVEVDRAAGEPVTTVCVLLEGTTTGVEARASRLVDELRTADDASDRHISGEPPPWWGHLPAGDVSRLSVPPAEVARAAHSVSGPVRGSGGVGSLLVGLRAGGRATELREVRSVADRLGGWAVLVCAASPPAADVDVWGPVPGVDLMRRIKEEFDPDGRLAPGRLPGGER